MPRYPNYHVMRKQRAVAIERAKNLCEICGGRARICHHIDEKRDNHRQMNLKVLCYSCHVKYHWEHGDRIVKPKILIAGKSIREWSKEIGVAYGTLYSRYQTSGKLTCDYKYGLDLCETAKILGLTKQRCHQLAKEGKLIARLQTSI